MLFFELDTDVILSKDSDRLWMTGKLRDASGSCSVSLTSAAVCQLLQVTDKEQALELKSQGKLVLSLVLRWIMGRIMGRNPVSVLACLFYVSASLKLFARLSPGHEELALQCEGRAA